MQAPPEPAPDHPTLEEAVADRLAESPTPRKSRAERTLRGPGAYRHRRYRVIAATPTPELDQPLRRLSNAANRSALWMAIAVGLGLFGGRRGRRAAAAGLASIGLGIGRGEPRVEVAPQAGPPRPGRGRGRGGPPRLDARVDLVPLGALRRRASRSPPPSGPSSRSPPCPSGCSPPPSPTRACTPACTTPATPWRDRWSAARSGSWWAGPPSVVRPDAVCLPPTQELRQSPEPAVAARLAEPPLRSHLPAVDGQRPDDPDVQGDDQDRPDRVVRDEQEVRHRREPGDDDPHHAGPGPPTNTPRPAAATTTPRTTWIHPHAVTSSVMK